MHVDLCLCLYMVQPSVPVLDGKGERRSCRVSLISVCVRKGGKRGQEYLDVASGPFSWGLVTIESGHIEADCPVCALLWLLGGRFIWPPCLDSVTQS
jgi:hypothetical protein